MSTGGFGVTGSIGGLSLQGNLSRTGDTIKTHEVTTSALAKTGTLTTRTNNTDGVITLTGGHGLSTGTFDIFWGSGSTAGSRFGVSHTIVTNADTITGGSGNNLPIATTAVTVVARTEIDSTFDGDNALAVLIAASGANANVQFTQSDGTTEVARKFVFAGEAFAWAYGPTESTSPITGTAVGKIFVSGADTATAATVKIHMLLDETP